MAVFYGYHRLKNAESWKPIVGPEKWAAGYSACELAHAWHGAGGIPKEIGDCLASSGPAYFRRLVLNVGLVEKPVFLDTMVGPSMTDLLGFASNEKGEIVVIAVEGKADEAFGYPVNSWLSGDHEIAPPDAKPRATRERRLRFLCDRLGLSQDAALPLRYQLLHRTVSALTEAQLHGAAAGIVLVHSFRTADDANWSAFKDFVGEMGVELTSKRTVSGPKVLGREPGIPIHFLWWDSEPRGSHRMELGDSESSERL